MADVQDVQDAGRAADMLAELCESLVVSWNEIGQHAGAGAPPEAQLSLDADEARSSLSLPDRPTTLRKQRDRFALNRPLQGFQQHSQNHDPYGEGQEYNHNVTRIKDLVLKLIDDEQEGAYTCCVVGGSVRPKREASRVR